MAFVEQPGKHIVDKLDGLDLALVAQLLDSYAGPHGRNHVVEPSQ